MRIIIRCLICSLLFNITATAQRMRVLKVTKKVYYHGSHKLIGKDMLLPPDVQMDFGTPDDTIYLVVPNVGIQWIDGAHAKRPPGTRSGELVATLKDLLLLHTRKEQIIGRGGIFDTPEEIGQYFAMLSQSPNGILVIDDWKLRVSKHFWVQRQQQFFLLKYSFMGTEISRRLSFVREEGPDSACSLLIDTNILRVNGRLDHNARPVNCQLFFYNTVLKAAQPLGPLLLNIQRLSALAPELCTIRSSGIPHWQEEGVNFLQAVYGQAATDYLLEKMAGIACKMGVFTGSGTAGNL